MLGAEECEVLGRGRRHLGLLELPVLLVSIALLILLLVLLARGGRLLLLMFLVLRTRVKRRGRDQGRREDRGHVPYPRAALDRASR